MEFDFFPVDFEVWVFFPSAAVGKAIVETVPIWLDEAHRRTVLYTVQTTDGTDVWQDRFRMCLRLRKRGKRIPRCGHRVDAVRRPVTAGTPAPASSAPPGPCRCDPEAMRNTLETAIRQCDPRHLMNPDQVDAIVTRAMLLRGGERTVGFIGHVVRDRDIVGMWPQSQVEAVARAVVHGLLDAARDADGIRPR